jgi:hypothetical protein
MNKELITQNEAVEEVIKNHGGYATLKEIYDEVLNIQGVDWKNTNDYKSNIRCLLQRDLKRFFKIKSGLWALVEAKDNLPHDILKLYYEKEEDTEGKKSSTHSYFQGQIIELGNSIGHRTYIPSQDKSCNYIHEKKLKDIVQIYEIPKFTHENIVNDARTIDVIWFNELWLPKAVFEIEHSTNFRRSLSKFQKLKDFNTFMFIVSHKERELNFSKVINGTEFRNIKDRVKFLDYEDIEEFSNLYINISRTKFFKMGSGELINFNI